MRIIARDDPLTQIRLLRRKAPRNDSLSEIFLTVTIERIKAVVFADFFSNANGPAFLPTRLRLFYPYVGVKDRCLFLETADRLVFDESDFVV